MKTQSLLEKFGCQKGAYTSLLVKIEDNEDNKSLGLMAIQEMMVEYGDNPSLLEHMIKVYCANLDIEITLLPLLLQAFIAKNNLAKLYTKDQVVKAMDFSHKEGLLYGANRNYKSSLNDYGQWIDTNL